MSAYRVAPSGQWWAPWTMPHHNPPGTRDATASEAEIMDKVIWETATSRDVKRLRQMLPEGTES